MYTSKGKSLQNLTDPSTRRPVTDTIIKNYDEHLVHAFNLTYGATIILMGDFTNTSLSGTLADISGTIYTKYIYESSGSLYQKETWSKGTDFVLDATDFSYELSRLSGDDIFEGIPLTGGNDRVQGMGGNDRFKGYDNRDEWGDQFYGGDGLDTSIYQGKISDYVVTASANASEEILDDRANDGSRVSGFYVSDTAVGRDDNDALIEVERLEFEVSEDNGANRIALDIDGNAGIAAKILGALWGKESVENATFVGIVLHYLDSGVSYEALLDLALGAILGANKTNEAIVELVFTNLVGEAPTQDVKTELASYMDSGAYSQAGFARAIADLELNATNINLVGLSDTGLQYTEYVP
jgi:serralysin